MQPCAVRHSLASIRRNGNVKIEDLRVGDFVTTLDNGPQPILWIGRKTLNSATLQAFPTLRPVFINSGALGNDRPVSVSQQHCILIGKDHLVRAKHLVNTTKGVRIAHGKRTVTYIHLMFEAHQIIFAENIASESFYPGKYSLSTLCPDERTVLRALLPALENVVDGASSAANVYGPTVRDIKRKRDLKKFDRDTNGSYSQFCRA